MNKKYEAILFDMDGVIVNTMPYHFQAWQQVFSQINIQVNKKEIYEREGEPGMVTLSEILYLHKRDITESEKVEILQEKERIFKQIVRPELFKGIVDLLEELKNHDFLLGLVTGTSTNEMNSILPEEVRGFFQVIVTGDSVKKGKPAPDPYLKALESFGLPSRQALVIENAPYGIRSAKQAQIKCIAIASSLSREYLQQADYICTSVEEVRELLFGLLLKEKVVE